MSKPVTLQLTHEYSDERSQMAHDTQTMIQRTRKLKAQTIEQMTACEAALESQGQTIQMLVTARSAGSEEF